MGEESSLPVNKAGLDLTELRVLRTPAEGYTLISHILARVSLSRVTQDQGNVRLSVVHEGEVDVVVAGDVRDTTVVVCVNSCSLNCGRA